MKNKRLISLILIGGMILSNVLPVYADITNGEVIEYSDIETDITSESELTSYNQDALVYYQSTESFSVKIPKKINLDGTQKNPQTSFNVSVSGDIDGRSNILVSSDENFYLKNDGKADVLAVVGYQRTFTSAEVIANTTDESGSVKVPNEDGNGLSAGAWSGTFKFYINYQGGNANAETYEVDEESESVLTYETIDNEPSNLSLAMIDLLGIHTVKADPIIKSIDESKKKGVAFITGLKNKNLDEITVADYYENENGNLYKIVGIRDYAFDGCENLENIKFSGTKEEWENLDKGENWNANAPIKNINTTDKIIRSAGLYYTLGYNENAQTYFIAWEDLGLNVEKDYTTGSYENYDILYAKRPTDSYDCELIFPADIKKIGSYAFNDCNGCVINNYDLSNTQITEIKNNAFNNADVRNIKFPNTLKTIKSRAFYNNRLLEYLDLSNTQIEEIDGRAFCAGHLKEVKLPKTLKILGDNSLDNGIYNSDEDITTIYYNGTIEEWNNIEKSYFWYQTNCNIQNITCSDGVTKP